MIVRRSWSALLALSMTCSSTIAATPRANTSQLETASRCVIVGGSDNRNNCPNVVIKKYYIEQKDTLGILSPDSAPDSTTCSGEEISAIAGTNIFVANAFPYAAIAMDGVPTLVLNHNDKLIVIAKLILLDSDGLAVASIRDNKFFVRYGYHVEKNSTSLSIYDKKTENPVLRLKMTSKCQITIYAVLNQTDSKTIVSPDGIFTNGQSVKGTFTNSVLVGATLCVNHGFPTFCVIPRERALTDD